MLTTMSMTVAAKRKKAPIWWMNRPRPILMAMVWFGSSGSVERLLLNIVGNYAVIKRKRIRLPIRSDVRQYENKRQETERSRPRYIVIQVV